MTSSIGFGAPTPKSAQTQVLQQIDYREQPFANKDFVRNMQWLNESVTSLSQYQQLMQKSIDQANTNIIDQIGSFAADLLVVFAGLEPTGVDLGDLTYVLQGIGALLGINPDTPFPLNLAEAAGNMFDNFLAPLPQFTDLIFDATIAWAETLGFSEAAVDSIQEFSDAVVSLYNGMDDTFGILGDMFGSLLKAFGVGSGGLDLTGIRGFWDALGGFLSNILEGPNDLLMNVLSNIVVFIFKSLTWVANVLNPSNLFDALGMKYIGPQLVPVVSSETDDWTVGSNINVTWVFDDTVTHANQDQINSGVNTGWWTVPYYTIDTSLGSFKTIGNSVSKRVIMQDTVSCTPGEEYYVSGYVKWDGIPAGIDTFGPCIVFFSGANEVSQTNVNIDPGHGATGDWQKLGQAIVVPQNVDGFRVGCRVSTELTTGTVWVDDLSCTGAQSTGAGMAQGILDFPRNLVSGIVNYIDGIVTFFFGENNILSKVLASIIPGLDATVITTGQFAQDMIQGLGDAIGNLWSAINGAIEDLGQLIHDLWYDPIGTIGEIAQSMVTGLGDALDWLGNSINGTINTLGQLISDLWNNPWDVIANLIASMIPGLDASKILSGQFAQDMVTGLTTALSDLANGINTALNNLGQLLSDLWNNPVEVIANLVAVMIPGLDASKITSGQYAMEMVAGLTDALSNLGNWVQDVIDAVIGAITGIPIIGGVVQGIIDGIESLFNGLFGQPAPAATIQAPAVPALDASKITTGEVVSERIAALDAAKITTGTFGNARIADGAISNAKVSGIAGEKVTTGSVASERIAALDASKITTGEFGGTQIANGAITDAKISNVAGEKVTTGSVAAERIAALDAAKITTGTFGNAQIASGLDAAKLTTGTLPIDRIANGAVSNTKIASGVDAAKLTTGTLPIDRIANGAVTNTKLGNDINGGKIAAGTVASDFIAALDASKVTTGEFAQSRVTDLESDFGDTWDSVVSGLQRVSSSGNSTTDVESVTNSIAQTLQNNSSAIAAMQSESSGGASTGVSATIEFANYSNAANLATPGFTQTYSGSGSGTWQVVSGLAAWVDGTNASRSCVARYNVTATETDYQIVTLVAGGAQEKNGTTYSANYAYGRMNSTGTTYVYAKVSGNTITLGCVVSGSNTVWATYTSSYVSILFGVGFPIYLHCGTPGGSRAYQVKFGSTAVISHTEVGTSSGLGASYRYTGMGIDEIYSGSQLAPSPISAFIMQDNPPINYVGSGFRAFRSFTSATSISSTGYQKLPNSFFDSVTGTSDDYTYSAATANKLTVGVTGWYIVNINIQLTINDMDTEMAPVLWKNDGTSPIAKGPSTWGLTSIGIAGTRGPTQTGGTFVVYLQAGDYIQPGYWQTTTYGASGEMKGDADGITTYFEVALLNRSFA